MKKDLEGNGNNDKAAKPVAPEIGALERPLPPETTTAVEGSMTRVNEGPGTDILATVRGT